MQHSYDYFKTFQTKERYKKYNYRLFSSILFFINKHNYFHAEVIKVEDNV